jgi:hypothetical protein
MSKNKYDIAPPDVELPWRQSGPLPDNFDVNVMPSPQKGFMLAVCGGRNTGKSVVSYNLLKHYAGCYDGIHIFSPTWQQDPTIGPEATGIPEENYHETIDEEFILDLMKKQDAEKKKFDKGIMKQKFLSRHLLVFDDCISCEGFNTQSLSGILNKISFCGRHKRLSCLITTQAYKALPKKFRVNIPNWIFMKTYNEGERKAIAEEQSNTMSEKQFNSLFDKAIEDEYSFFYVFLDAEDKSTCFRKNLTNILKIN